VTKWVRIPLVLSLLLCGGCEQHQKAVPAQQSRQEPDRPIMNAFPEANQTRLFVETDIDQQGKATFNKPQGLVLSAEQRKAFESLIKIHTIAPDDVFAACFIPHHFFRYYNKSGKVIGEFAVCFCCSGVEQSGASNIRLSKNRMLSADFRKLEAFVRSLGERTDMQCAEDRGGTSS
jgi:hypothetical protein